MERRLRTSRRCLYSRNKSLAVDDFTRKTNIHKLKIKLLPTALVCADFTNAKVPNYFWTKSVSGDGMDNGTSVATDASGNNIVTGNFTGPTITFGTTTLTKVVEPDMFLLKISDASTTGIEESNFARVICFS